jgi:propionyl-CoA synthetase
MASIADSKPFKAPATIDDPMVLDEIQNELQTLGFGK